MEVSSSSQNNQSRPHTGEEIRNAFLEFFADRGHKIIPSASLIPDDPTVLLTIAGMLPFKPVFLGQLDRPAPRATSIQKCIRTNDIENVGRTARHHTFFEMLGNFSFGDYFKKEAIQWAWELSTQVFGLDEKNLIISIFREDDETDLIWRKVVGVDSRKIIRMDEADNFWSSGDTGPCGPCSEIYFDFKPELGTQNIDLEDGTRFIEFYNLVFMEYNRDKNGHLTPLTNCNIDTGMGLERMAQILQGSPNNYETDLIYPLIVKIASLAVVNYLDLNEKEKISIKIIADHSRAVVHLICDGVLASNLGRGYVLRRLLRRMIRHGRLIGINKKFLKIIGHEVIIQMKSIYPALEEKKELILNELENEEIRFLETLDRGEKLLQEIVDLKPSQISGNQAFELYDTYGFPLELTQEIAEENGILVDVDGFQLEMSKQRERAKSSAIKVDLTIQNNIEKLTLGLTPTVFEGFHTLESSSKVMTIFVDGKIVDKATSGSRVELILDKTPFFGESGGQVGDRGIIFGDELKVEIKKVSKEKNIHIHSGFIKQGELRINELVNTQVDSRLRRRAQANHTATHLLQAALKNLIDPSIGQRGSLVAFDRLRFDFNFSQALKFDELNQIETLVNDWITENHPLVVQTMPIDKALQAGALAMFGEKYGDIVRVVDVPGVSMELCGGTHVMNTAELGAFKIISESGVASGTRRIEALAGQSILDYLNDRDHIVKELSETFKAQPIEIIDRVTSLQNDIKEITKEYKQVCKQFADLRVMSLLDQSVLIRSSQYIVQRLDEIDGDTLQAAAKHLLSKLGDNAAVILGGLPEPTNINKVILVAAFGNEIVIGGLHAGKFVGPIAKICGGGGGGRADIAQAGGRNGSTLDLALDTARDQLKLALT